MKKELYLINEKNNKWIGNIMYSFYDLFYLSIASFLVYLIIVEIINNNQISLILFYMVLILLLIYPYKRDKKMYCYKFYFVKIESDGLMILKGYKGYDPFEIEFNINDIKYQYLTIHSLKNMSHLNIFILNNNDKIYIDWKPPEIYEVLNSNFPNSELKKTWTFHFP